MWLSATYFRCLRVSCFKMNTRCDRTAGHITHGYWCKLTTRAHISLWKRPLDLEYFKTKYILQNVHSVTLCVYFKEHYLRYRVTNYYDLFQQYVHFKTCYVEETRKAEALRTTESVITIYFSMLHLCQELFFVLINYSSNGWMCLMPMQYCPIGSLRPTIHMGMI